MSSDTGVDTTLFQKTVLKGWETQITRANQFFDSASDEQLMKEVAPGRSRGIYLLGHLTAVHDAIFPLLGIRQRLYPQLEQIFVNEPDSPELKMPSIKELKVYWHAVNEELMKHLLQFSAEEWLSRHNSVTPEDFAKEPHRNKLGVMITRTAHVSYHLGQLIFLREKS